MGFLQKCKQLKEDRIDVQEAPSQMMGRTRRIDEINAEQRGKRRQQKKAVDINNSWV